MINLPSGLEVDNLIEDLRVLSWEASDILLYYAQLIRNPNTKSDIITSNKKNDPVTKADLKAAKSALLLYQWLNKKERKVKNRKEKEKERFV